MNFLFDFAEIARKQMRTDGIDVPDTWDDYCTCVKYVDIYHRRFNSKVPYIVVFSKTFEEKIQTLSELETAALNDIIHRVKNCETITPYMSKQICRPDIKRSDFFLKNWDIYHLHLEKAIKGRSFKNSKLLFFQCKARVIHFIDIRKHPRGSEWFLRDLLEIIYDNWPWLLKYLPDLSVVSNIADEKMHDMLKKGLALVPIRKRIAMPTTCGVATSGDSIMAVEHADAILYKLKSLEQAFEENEEAIRKELRDSMNIHVPEPLDFKLIIEEGKYAIIETHAGVIINPII